MSFICLDDCYVAIELWQRDKDPIEIDLEEQIVKVRLDQGGKNDTLWFQKESCRAENLSSVMVAIDGWENIRLLHSYLSFLIAERERCVTPEFKSK